MKAKLLIIVAMVGLLFSCDMRRAEMTQRVIDSLQTELEMNKQMNTTLVEIGTLIDSIDANRKLLRTRMLEGATYESYVARMRDINDYVRKTERKLEALQRTAKKSNDPALKTAINKLKADLEVRNHELAAVREQVKLYQSENEELIQKVSLQQTEIADKLQQLTVQQEQAVRLEQQVSQLLTKAKLDQGEALYAQAGAVEETANRTRFAPKKKRNTRKQAIELYKLALFYGKEEAQAKITELEKKL